jgi:hypothetical protein
MSELIFVLQGFPLFPRRSLGNAAQRRFQRSLHPISDILFTLLNKIWLGKS